MPATTASVAKGFCAPCPKCGDEEGVRVALDDLSLHCLGCDQDIEVDDIRALVDGWVKVLAWLDAAPAKE